jgi:hypothetical protein
MYEQRSKNIIFLRYYFIGSIILIINALSDCIKLISKSEDSPGMDMKK